MKKFEILDIYANTYERNVTVRELKNNKIFKLYFLEYGEFAEEIDEKDMKRKKGDILEGKLYITLVSKIKKTETELKYEQPRKTEGINAVVEITKIIDEYSFHAFSSIQEEEILVEVEDVISFREGDRVYIEGVLEIVPKEHMEDKELETVFDRELGKKVHEIKFKE